MEYALLEAILKVLTELRIFKIAHRKNKDRIYTTVESIQKAANRTKNYYSSIKPGQEVPNIELSEEWLNAARAIRDLDEGLYNRLLSKADFSANPRNWTPELSEKHNIYLDDILEDSKRILNR